MKLDKNVFNVILKGQLTENSIRATEGEKAGREERHGRGGKVLEH